MSLSTSSPSPSLAPDPPAPETLFSRKRVVLSLAWLAAAVVGLAVINLARLDHLTGDQFTLLSVVQFEQDPGRYARDGLFRDPSWYQSYLPWYRALIKQLVHSTGNGPLAIWLLSVSLTLAMAVSFWLCFYWLKVDPYWATWGAILGILPRSATGSELTGAGIMECVLPRTFFSVGLPLVLLLMLRSKLRGPWCVLSFFLLGLLGNFHPQSAFFATGGLLLVLLAQRWRDWRAWVQVPACGLAAIVGILPFSIHYPWEVSAPTASTGNAAGEPLTRAEALGQMLVAGGGSTTDELAEQADEEELGPATSEEAITVARADDPSEALLLEEEAAEESAETDPPPGISTWKYLSSLSSYVLRNMNYRVTLPTLALIVLPLLLGTRLLRTQTRETNSLQHSAARVCYSAAVLICGLSMCLEIFNRILAYHQASIPLLDSVQPLRATRLVAPLAITAFVLFLAGGTRAFSWRTPRLRWAVGCLLFPVLVTVATGEYVFQTRYKPVQAAARWAKENTTEHTLFLIDPPGAIAFRTWADRPVVWSRHDAVCVGGERRPKVRREIRRIERAYDHEHLNLLVGMAREYRAKFILYSAPRNEHNKDIGYQVGPFVSLQPRPANLRTATPTDSAGQPAKY